MSVGEQKAASGPGMSAAARAGVRIRTVPFDQPWVWVGAGWRDLWSIPNVSLPYGAAFALAAVGMFAALMQLSWQSLILVLAGGFLILGPMLAVGLYEASRRLEKGEHIGLAQCLASGLGAAGQLAFMGALLTFCYLVWVEFALLLYALFMGSGGLPPLEQFIPTLLFTRAGLGLLVVGTIIGALFAGIVFAITAVSLPLLMRRRVDVITAAAISTEVCVRNPKPMALWAAIIAASMMTGFATLFVGLVVAFPLIGHATWHAYRELIDEQAGT